MRTKIHMITKELVLGTWTQLAFPAKGNGVLKVCMSQIWLRATALQCAVSPKLKCHILTSVAQANSISEVKQVGPA